MYNCCKITSDCAVIYGQYAEGFPKRDPEPGSGGEPLACHTHGFSMYAEKRMRGALDNFVSMQEMVPVFKYKPIYELKRKRGADKVVTYTRKPVFLTLTVPDQQMDDKEVKNKLLDPFLYNLRRSNGLVNYVWRAEAQERGSIHFHIAGDCFLDHKRIRRLWFRYLKEHNCLGTFLKKEGVEKASSISNIQLAKDLRTLKFELGGYFGAKRDEEGRLIHKHDKTKRVRDIEGNAWGCSDTLKYRAFTLEYTTLAVEDAIKEAALFSKTIEREDGKRVADLHVFRQVSKYKGKKFVKEKQYDPSLKKVYNMYHFEKALQAYSKHESLEGYDKSWFMQLHNNHTYHVQFN